MSSSFAKKLADSDKRVRDKTFVNVSKWLASRETLTAIDGKKLWRGLFYSYWHADGRATQLEVANKMGALVHVLNREVAMVYLEAGLWTMRTEWGGIDKHRMDKYCLLTRRVLHHGFRFAGERGWDMADDIGRAMAEAIFGAPKSAQLEGIGFKLHVAEVFLREVEAVCKGETGLAMDDGEEEIEAGAPTPIPSGALAALVVVFINAMQKEESNVLLKRIRTDVFEPLTDASRASEDPRAPRLTPSALKKLYERAITLGAEHGVDDACRESLYELHAMLKKGASKIKKDAEARGEDPEAEDVASPPKKRKQNGVSQESAGLVNGSTEKKKKKTKRKVDEVDELVDEEAAKKEKKRRKRERRLAKELAAREAEEERSAKKKKKKKSSSKSSDDAATAKSSDAPERSGSKLVAMRAVVDRGNSASPTPSLDSLDSPSMSPRSKRLMWNDEGITYSSPDLRGPINTKRGKQNLRLTPTKTIFRPIHGKTHSAPPKQTKTKLSNGVKRSAEAFF
jgi:ribosomal RNA-processing protein 1